MQLRTAFDDARRIGAEYHATRFAVDHVSVTLGRDGSLAVRADRAGVTATQLARAAAGLERTFTITLFVQFEAVLRDYWVNGLKRSTRPDMRPLMDSIARRRDMNADDLDAAHAVREYRNAVVHGNALVMLLRLDQCQRGLGRYLRWLPQQW